MWGWVKLPKAIALMAFALPWLTVSCSNTVLVSASGWSLATGRLTVVNPLTGAREVQGGHPSLWLVAAMIVVAIGLAVSFRERRAARVVLLTSVAALALVLAGTRQFDTDMMREEVQKRHPGRDAEQVARLIRIDRQVGYWLELATLAAAAGMAGLVVAGRDRAPPSAG